MELDLYEERLHVGFSMLLFLCLLCPTPPVCKVRLYVEFQENLLLPEIIFIILNQILFRIFSESTGFPGSVQTVHSDLNLITCRFWWSKFHFTTPVLKPHMYKLSRWITTLGLVVQARISFTRTFAGSTWDVLNAGNPVTWEHKFQGGVLCNWCGAEGLVRQVNLWFAAVVC